MVGFPPSDLEDFVDDLKKDSTSASRVVTLKDVEDGAFLLRQVGEAVASLKGEPPPWNRRGIQTTHQTVKDSFVHVGRGSSSTHCALFWVLRDASLNRRSAPLCRELVLILQWLM